MPVAVASRSIFTIVAVETGSWTLLKTSHFGWEFDSIPVLICGGFKCGDRQVSGTLMSAMRG